MKLGTVGRIAGGALALVFTLAAIAATPRAGAAQQAYFGKNEVQYDKLNWRVKTTEHFDVHYYETERGAAMIAAEMAERSYARLSRIFNHTFRERKPIIVFASRGDFAQNNVTGDLGEGTGGVTDPLRERNMFFFTGDLHGSEHVLAHEMVHQFQFDIYNAGRGGFTQIAQANPPAWFIEGMAEFLSIGPKDFATDAILRDAALNGNIPSVEQMTTRPDEFFPYRYGESFLAWIAKRWGDDVIGEVMQSTPAVGIESAFKRHTGLKLDELGDEWKEAMQTEFLPPIAQRDRARKFAQPILDERHTGGSTPIYVAPALSPDGRDIVFLSTGSFARAEVFLDLYLADAATGKRKARLTKSEVNPEFEELRAIYSQSAFTPDGKYIAFTAQKEGRDVLDILEVRRAKVVASLDKTGLEQMISPSFSPDGHQIVFSGLRGGFSDLYVIDRDGRNMHQLTNDPQGDHQPQWSPDGTKIAFASERAADADLGVLRFGEWRICVLDLATGQIDVLPNQAGRNLNPMWSPDGQSIAYVSDRTGTPNVFLYDFKAKEQYQLTNVVGSVMSFTEESPAISWAREADRMAFVYYDNNKYTVWAVDNPRLLKKQPFRATPATATVVAEAAGAAAEGAHIGPAQPPVGLRSLTSASDSSGRRLSAYRAAGNEFRSAASTGQRTGSIRGNISLAALLDSANLALPDTNTFKDTKYSPTLRAEYVNRPQLGYTQTNFGRGVYGGTTIVLQDMLANRLLAISASVNGRIDEAQAFVAFASNANRYQYMTGFEQQPIFFLQDASQIPLGSGAYQQSMAISRYIIRQGFFNGSYPLNRFARVETGLSVNSIERATEYLSQQFNVLSGISTGLYADSIVNRSTLTYANPYVAYVFDNTLYGYTAPIYGHRMRAEIGPTFGGANWMHYALDYRRYDPIVFNYLTVATRVQTDMSIGRDEMEFPKYIGLPYYVRGYDHSSYSASECGGLVSTATACTATQLLGSRVAFANAELRFPILTNAVFGLLPVQFPPIEGLVFYDIGAAWRGGQSLSLTKPANYDPNADTQRYFLSSHGFGIRVNLFNIAIVRWDYAIPHDGPSKKGYWVWTLGPSY